MTRHEKRVNLFLLTFEEIFNGSDIDELLENAYECDEINMNEEIENDFKNLLENKHIIDSEIKKYLSSWTIDRISKVSLAVLRVAMYELVIKKDVDIDIAISEAVIITQEYSLKEDISFVNGVLSSVSKAMKNE